MFVSEIDLYTWIVFTYIYIYFLGGEKQLLVDYKGLDGLLEKIVSLSISIESYRTLIDLYVALERVIRSYLRKWNRTNLVKVLFRLITSTIQYALAIVEAKPAAMKPTLYVNDVAGSTTT